MVKFHRSWWHLSGTEAAAGMEYAGVPARAPDGSPLPVSHTLYAANK